MDATQKRKLHYFDLLWILTNPQSKSTTCVDFVVPYNIYDAATIRKSIIDS